MIPGMPKYVLGVEMIKRGVVLHTCKTATLVTGRELKNARGEKPKTAEASDYRLGHWSTKES